MDFTNVIDEKLAALRDDRETLGKNAFDFMFHVKRVNEQLLGAIEQINDLEDDPALIKAEFVSVIKQVAPVLVSSWNTAHGELGVLDQEIKRFEEMRSMYVDWSLQAAESEQESDFLPQSDITQYEPDIVQGVLDGTIPEPSKKSAIRRKPGTRPPLTLKQYRQIQGGEDSSE